MTSRVTFFPVDNGDMTLIRLSDEHSTNLLIDCKIRQSADNPDDTTPDVATALRKKLNFDENNRPYIDAMLLSHPDEDHCLGLKKHFWLDSVDKYPDDDKANSEKRIIIRQIWASPLIFKRADKKNHPLCADAKAFNSEARRRIKENKENCFCVPDGDRILVIGEDTEGNTDEIKPIVVQAGEKIDGINGQAGEFITSHFLAPISLQDEETEERLSKNKSSVIVNFKIKSSLYSNSYCQFLTGGDAEVEIWDRIYDEYDVNDLEYHLLLAPHHCSWRSLSYDSWSDNGEKAKVSDKARTALAQAKHGALIVSSSKAIADDQNDPPCIRAKREYKAILKPVNGLFKCTGEEPTKFNPSPLELKTTASGFVLAVAASSTSTMASTTPPRAG